MAIATLDETVRYCGTNKVLCELTYNGTVRVVEVYSYRTSGEGMLLLYAVDIATGTTKSFRIDRIEQIKATDKSFSPRFPVEF